jgi:hypothetical protein
MVVKELRPLIEKGTARRLRPFLIHSLVWQKGMGKWNMLYDFILLIG